MMYNSPGAVSSHLPSSTATTAPRNPTISYPLLHHDFHHPIMMPLPPPPFSTAGGGAGDDEEFPVRDERFPQWSNQETRDFIEIRAQLEWEFTTAKRNKNLWEMVANRMREKGYRRTTDQCKAKWKNLVNRYKDQEASDADNSRQYPFFDELHAVFTARANIINQPQLNSETGTAKGRKMLINVSQDQSHKEFSDEQEEEEDAEGNQKGSKRKANKEKRQKIGEKEDYSLNANKNESVLNTLQEILRNFILQQQKIDMQWRELIEKRAEERVVFEQEWRAKMEKLEKERLVMEQAWRERDEQRRLREESRAEKRDALLTTLLNKLIRDASP